jgi:hypothetical protein
MRDGLEMDRKMDSGCGQDADGISEMDLEKLGPF